MKIVDVIKNRVKDIDDQLNGLNDYNVKALHFFLKEVMKLDNYSIFINTNDLEIIILPKTYDNLPIFDIKDDDLLFDFLVFKLNIPKYKIRFCSESDYAEYSKPNYAN
jgi:hypothetical protein